MNRWFLERARGFIRYTLPALACGVSFVAAVPLENWRAPFYFIAAQRGDFVGCPSGMFWDDMGVAPVMYPRLWPDAASFSADHYHCEPALTFSGSTREYMGGSNTNIHFGFLSDFKFKNLTVRNVLDVDQDYGSNPDYIWHQERGAAGRIGEAYLQYDGKHGFARLGRVNRCWGPFPDRSILLSNNPFSYDAFEWQFFLRFLEFRYLFSAFPGTGSERDTYVDGDLAGGSANRYFAAHALNFIFGSWASLGVSETMVFARSSGFPDLQYINPFSVYSVVNTNQEGSGNLMIGFQGWCHPFFRNVTLRGQVVFDDIQVDDEKPGDQEPPHWALDVDCTVKDPLPVALRHHVNVSYRYLSKWMYTVSQGNTLVGERYSYLGRSLGYPENDGDEFRITLAAMGKNYWAATLYGGFARRDTNTIMTPWIHLGESANALGYREEEPFSRRSNVETTYLLGISAHGYFRDFCALHVTFENCWVKNKNNVITNRAEYDPRLSFSFSGQYSNIFLKIRDKGRGGNAYGSKDKNELAAEISR